MRGIANKLIALILSLVMSLSGNGITNNKQSSVADVSSTLDCVSEINSYRPISLHVNNSNNRAQNILSQLYGSLPETYDSRDVNGANYVTSVKTQKPYGTCWAFSALAAAESSLLKKGIYEDIDLSEFHFSYFFYNESKDPLGYSDGDRNIAISSDYLEIGGNNILTMFALANWRGVALESDFPYSQIIEDRLTKIDKELSFSAAAHLENAYIIPLSDKEAVKRKIMEHGAASISYYDSKKFMNNETGAYYNDSYTTTNHAVTIIGWDDHYSIDNYKEDARPKSEGAWLIKNSWGEESGLSGYFWLSYEDASITTSYSNAFFYDFGRADNYQNNYQHDAGASNSFIKVDNGSSVANVFTVKGDADEMLKAVSIALYDVDVDYSIQIYKNLTDLSNPTSGTPVFATPQEGRTTYVGYYTIELDKSVRLKPNESFSVVFTLSQSEGSNLNHVKVFADADFKISWFKCDSHTTKNVSFVQYAGIGHWYDLYDFGNDEVARIKAFTDAMTVDDKFDIKDALVTGISKLYQFSDVFVDEMVVTFDGNTLISGVDYDVEYSDINLGLNRVRIVGKDRYEGVKDVFFLVHDGDITSLTRNNILTSEVINKDTRIYSLVNDEMGNMRIDVKSFDMNSSENRLTVTVFDKDLNVIKSATDGEMGLSFFVQKMEDVYVVVTPLEGFAGSYSIEYIKDSTKTHIGNASVLIEETEYNYGEAIKPSAIITYDSIVLEQNVHYKLSYRNNINAGKAVCIISALDDSMFEGSIEVTFDILPKDESKESIVNVEESVEYTGKEIVFEDIEIDDSHVVLRKNYDYILSYEDNVNVGTAKIIVKFIGNYTGTIVEEFAIVPCDINNSSITYLGGTALYESEQFYDINIQLSKEIVDEIAGNHTYDLKNGIDYELVYDEIIYGVNEITLKGINNYSGSKVVKILVYENKLDYIYADELFVTGVVSEAETRYYKLYDSICRKFELLISGNDVGNMEILVFAQDLTLIGEYVYVDEIILENENIDTYYILIKNQNGSESGYRILANNIETPIDIEYANVEVVEQNVEYNVLGARPVIKIDFMGEELEEGIDYELICTDNNDIGEATYEINGIGNYCGQIMGGYTVIRKDVSNAKVSGVATSEYTGEEITYTLSIKDGATILVEGVDYNVTYYNNINVGKGSVHIEYIGNYTGENTIEFNIVESVPGDITSDEFVIDYEKGYIVGVEPMISVEEFLDKFNETEYLVIMDNNYYVSLGENVGTGMKICLVNNQNVIKSYEIVVTGDVSGDGRIGVTDMLAIKAYILGRRDILGTKYLAADLSGNGVVNITDFIKLKKILMGRN